jgi:AcrR family transcriptional regulator
MFIYKIAMGRSKTISDRDLLDRLMAAMGDVGPDGLSFAKAGRAVGLSPATLVQRFGTRDAMVQAVLLHGWDQLDAATATADAEAAANPAGAVALLMRLMPGDSAEHNLTDGLLLLREDFRNPVLRARGSHWGERLATALGRRLTDDRVAADRLGWQMASVWQGAVIWWGFRRDSEPAAAIRAMLEDWCRTAGLR